MVMDISYQFGPNDLIYDYRQTETAYATKKA